MIELIRSLWTTNNLANHQTPTGPLAQANLKIIYLIEESEWPIQSKSTRNGEMRLEYISKHAADHHDRTTMGLTYSTLLTKKKDQLVKTNMQDDPKITIYIRAISASSSMVTRSQKLSNLECLNLWTSEGRIAITIHFTDSLNLLIQLRGLITKVAIHLDVASIEC